MKTSDRLHSQHSNTPPAIIPVSVYLVGGSSVLNKHRVLPNIGEGLQVHVTTRSSATRVSQKGSIRDALCGFVFGALKTTKVFNSRLRMEDKITI
jgi:hypothetical protein